MLPGSGYASRRECFKVLPMTGEWDNIHMQHQCGAEYTRVILRNASKITANISMLARASFTYGEMDNVLDTSATAPTISADKEFIFLDRIKRSRLLICRAR
ncbi:hypothetical protein FOPG_15713 [Fusarium oxysporum f. sp. conglutinans race 2 54008]|uniref:Uncharacterized protein n=1 Tax=Fusarium oxysporum f. sp. conglutinans race 2 54008 TaxID=1089457 RepID=X0GXV0_FUSOX|nr:hypothetical protein FOPG_15713 [Fusarium oxysporum f. sp. conglutinans race 2 54008]